LSRLFAALAEGDAQTPVPTCPGWTFAELTAHVRGTQRWVEQIVRTGERARFREVTEDVSPQQLVATLRAADPDESMWTLGRDQHVRFWRRRMLHEALVHRVDAELALGRDPVVEPVIAADAIEEFLDNLTNFDWLAERLATFDRWGQSLHVHSTDGEGEWVITFEAPGFVWTRRHQKATVAVLGSTGDLMMLLYGRRSPRDPRFTVFGPPALLESWQQHTSF
jgi:uncharacterized protein (TIGR03083 family)